MFLPKLKNKIFYEFVLVSFFPGVLIIISKILITLLLSFIFEIKFSLSGVSFSYNQVSDFIFINDLGNTISFLILFSFAMWYLIKGYFLHDSHISPKFSVWLALQDLSHLVSGSMGIYLRIISYGIFVWLYISVIGLWYVIGLGTLTTFLICLSLGVIYTVLSVLDIEREYLIYSNFKKELI